MPGAGCHDRISRTGVVFFRSGGVPQWGRSAVGGFCRQIVSPGVENIRKTGV